MTKQTVKEEAKGKSLRERAIDELKDLVKNKPDEFDSERLDEVIAQINSVPDEHLDAYLVLQEPFKLVCRQVEFTPEELEKIKGMLEKNFTVLNFTQCEKDDRTRDDYGLNVSTKQFPHVSAWISKMRPMFADYEDGYFNILLCGGLFSYCNYNFKTIDEMVLELKNMIENYKG
jgi:hypothetical protein